MKRSKKIFLIISSFILISFIIIFLLYPRIKLVKGDLIIELNSKYEEPGFKAYNLITNLNKKVKITNDINNKIVGNYTVKYSVVFLDYKKVITRNVKVLDYEKPVITLKGDNPVKICRSNEIGKYEYSAYDNYDGDITDKVEVENKDEQIIYKVRDSSGNIDIKYRNIDLIDDTNPIIKLKGNSTIYVYKNDKYKEEGYNAYDECDGDLTDKVKVTGTVNTNKIGTYKIKYSVKDNDNKETSVIRTVIVANKINVQSQTGNGKIYLTFDDGPSNTITSKLLTILKEENVKATFFVIDKPSNLDYLIKREYNDGHTIGLHSSTHNYSIVYKSSESYFNDLTTIKNKVKRLTGYDSKIIRFPGGSSNTVSKKYNKGIMTYLTSEVTNREFKYFDWNISSGDAGGAKTKADVYNNVVKNLRKDRTNVVLMHDFENNYKTLNAVRDIIRYGKANGYSFEAITMSTPQVIHHVNN